MADGIEILRLIDENLRSPSDTALPYQTRLNKLSAVVVKKKLDLAMNEQNTLAKVSAWFTPQSNDIVLSGIAPNILFPIRVETRTNSPLYYDTPGEEIPILNFQVLNDSNVPAVSFYGSPMRLAFNSLYYPADAYGWNAYGRSYRIVYESDFADEVAGDAAVNLPDYFNDMIAAEAAYSLLLLVQDNSDEWMLFVKNRTPQLMNEIADWRRQWDEFKRRFFGKARVQKKTFLHRRGRTGRGIYGSDLG